MEFVTFATVEQLNFAREAACESLDVLNRVNRSSVGNVFLLDHEEFQSNIDENVASVREFCEWHLKEFVPFIQLGPVHEWLPFGDLPSAYFRMTERVLRTIERTTPARVIYPFGQYNEDSSEECYTVAYKSAHAVALLWAHDFAEPYLFDPDTKKEGWLDELIQEACSEDEQYSHRELMRSLCFEHDLVNHTIDELKSDIVNEWRAALEFVEREGAPPDRSADQRETALADLVASRVNELERDILQAIHELNAAQSAFPTNAEIAKQAGVSAQQAKESTGALHRHGVLDRGPTGRGYAFSEFGREVATKVPTGVRTDTSKP